MGLGCGFGGGFGGDEDAGDEVAPKGGGGEEGFSLGDEEAIDLGGGEATTGIGIAGFGGEPCDEFVVAHRGEIDHVFLAGVAEAALFIGGHGGPGLGAGGVNAEAEVLAHGG